LAKFTEKLRAFNVCTMRLVPAARCGTPSAAACALLLPLGASDLNKNGS
jgi:hypothetical protein